MKLKSEKSLTRLIRCHYFCTNSFIYYLTEKSLTPKQIRMVMCKQILKDFQIFDLSNSFI
jgi:hypothetical protein